MKKISLLTVLLLAVLFTNAQKKDTVEEKFRSLPNINYEIGPRINNEFLDQYLGDKISVPNDAIANPHKYAVAALHIDSNGIISNIRLFKSYSPQLNNQITNVFNELPKLKPAYNEGHNIAIDLAISIWFGKRKSTDSTITTICSDYSPDYDPTKDYSNVFNAVEKVPTFPGGNEALGKFLSSNIKYPRQAWANHIQGIVYISFVVDTDGSVGNLKIVWSPDDDLSMETLRVMHRCPNFIPGIQNGKPFRCMYTLPVSFKL